MAQSPQKAGLRSLWVPVGAIAAAAVWLLALREFAGPAADLSLIPGSPVDVLGAVAVPTLGEWGMLFATLSLLAAGTTLILRRRRR